MTKIKIKLDNLNTECTHESGAAIQTGLPKDLGGEGKFFSPTDLFAASLGTCMLTIMGVAAKKAGFDMKGTTAEIEKEMGASPRRVAKIIVRIRCPHTPGGPVREKLEAAALDCPVHRSLHPDIKQEIDFVWGI